MSSNFITTNGNVPGLDAANRANFAAEFQRNRGVPAQKPETDWAFMLNFSRDRVFGSSEAEQGYDYDVN